MCRNEWGRKLHFRDAISGYYGLQSAIVSFDPIHLSIKESIKYACGVNNLAANFPTWGRVASTSPERVSLSREVLKEAGPVFVCESAS